MLSEIVNSCRFLLQNYYGATECRDYLNSRLTPDSQDKFEFGYFPNIQNIEVLTSLIDENKLKENKLLFSKEIEDAWCSRTINFSYLEDYPLIMPFKDAYGNVVALVGRSLLSDAERKAKKIPKYKNTKFTKGNFLFGLYENKDSILENNGVYIVEGQFDVIKANEKGLKNVVALGNSNMTYYQFSLIMRYTNNIFLLLDNDEAGEKGRKRIINKFGSLANIHNFYLPEPYKDIDEFFSHHDYEDLSFTVKG